MAKVKRFLIYALQYISLIIFSFIAVLPIYSCLTTAFKTSEEYNSTNVMVWPGSWLNFSNFTTAWTTANMGHAFLISLIILVCTLVISTLIGTQLAYVLNRFKFPGNSLIRSAFLFASLLPGVAMQVALYKIMVGLHFINSVPGYIIMTAGTDVLSIYIYIQFFENIPNALDESGIVDGANYFIIFYRILLPLLKPAIVTACILKGVSVWNEYYAASLYLQSKNLKTVATSLYTFVGPMGNQYNLICAAVILSLLPALIVFICCQKQIYAGMVAGSVKG